MFCIHWGPVSRPKGYKRPMDAISMQTSVLIKLSNVPYIPLKIENI